MQGYGHTFVYNLRVFTYGYECIVWDHDSVKSKTEKFEVFKGQIQKKRPKEKHRLRVKNSSE